MASAASVLPGSLQNPVECLPSRTLDVVRVAIRRFIRDVERNSRIGLAHRFPIAEIPCFQFLNRDAVDHLPRRIACVLADPHRLPLVRVYP